MLSCIFVSVRVYILCFMKFFDPRVNDLIKTTLRNASTLVNQLRGQNSTFVEFVEKAPLSFLVKVKRRSGEMERMPVGFGEAGFKVRAILRHRLDQEWLDAHSMLVKPINFFYWFHLVPLAS